MGEFSGWKKEQTIQQLYFNLKTTFTVFANELEKPKPPPKSSMISPIYLSFTRQHPFAAAMMYSGYSQVQEISPGGAWWKKSGTKSHEVIKVNRFVLVAAFFLYMDFINDILATLTKCHQAGKYLFCQLALFLLNETCVSFFGTPSLPSSDQKKSIFPTILLHDVERHLFSHSFQVELADSQDHHMVSASQR